MVLLLQRVGYDMWAKRDKLNTFKLRARFPYNVIDSKLQTVRHVQQQQRAARTIQMAQLLLR